MLVEQVRVMEEVPTEEIQQLRLTIQIRQTAKTTTQLEMLMDRPALACMMLILNTVVNWIALLSQPHHSAALVEEEKVAEIQPLPRMSLFVKMTTQLPMPTGRLVLLCMTPILNTAVN